YSLLFWRSFTQWIGGIGILIMFILLISSPGISSYYIYEAEGKTQRIRANIHNTAKRIFVIYGFYTVVGIILLFIVGMPLFDSITHTFSAISTGGFSVKNSSIAFYKNIWIEVVIIFLMIIGATSFFIHDKLLKGNVKDYFKNKETQLFFFIAIVFSILLSMFFISENPLRSGVFHTFSALTTTGFSIMTNLSESSKFLIIILMIIGGYAGSTAGGIKLIRIGMLSNAILWLNKKISSPVSAVIPFKFDKKIIKDYEVSILSIFVLIYIITLVISTLIISLSGYSFIDSMFISASAEGTVGLSTIDIYSMPFTCKIMLMIDMLIGRLEIIPFMFLFYHIFSGIRKRLF
ncbi:MAG: potassium transporter TrkG, partial [Candidatus Aenigmatarchaeota archaeon]